MAKDNGYSARIIFITPPSIEELETRLKNSGIAEEDLEGILKTAQEDIEHSKSGEIYDAIITNDNLDETYKALEEFIYGTPGEAEAEAEAEAEDVNGNANGAAAVDDVAMEDAVNGEETPS